MGLVSFKAPLDFSVELTELTPDLQVPASVHVISDSTVDQVKEYVNLLLRSVQEIILTLSRMLAIKTRVDPFPVELRPLPWRSTRSSRVSDFLRAVAPIVHLVKEVPVAHAGAPRLG